MGLMLIAVGLLLIAAVGYDLTAGIHMIGHLHPAMAILLGVDVLLALCFIGVGIRRWRRRKTAARGRRLRKVLVGVPVVGIGLVLALATAWLRPMGTVASTDATGLEIHEDATSIVIRPATESEQGLVFYPGAKVDPHAYEPMLAQVSRGCGCTVAVVKPPLQIAFLASASYQSVMAANPQVTSWTLGGHSLGGVVAALGVAAEAESSSVDGLTLWASYPAQSTTLAERNDLKVTSIFGTRDGLTEQADIESSKVRLPQGTSYVMVDGANHAFFGDYGPQPGDGEATIDRPEGRQQIVDATVGALTD